MKKEKLFSKILMTVAASFLIGCATSDDDTTLTPIAPATQATSVTSTQATESTSTQDSASVSKSETTTFVCEDYAEAAAVIQADLYENFTADGTVYINFEGTTVKAYIGEDSSKAVTATGEEQSLGKISDTKLTMILSSNTLEDEANGVDEASNGVILQYKGSGKVKYVLSGSYTGTLFIKNKKADAAVVLQNANITSDSGYGPALRFSSQNRTFIVIPAGTESTITDTRVLNQSGTMYDDKKGSVYAKGVLIFTGEISTSEGGTLSVVNKGYKHAIYSKDYIRIANVTLNSTVEGTTGRDCLRSLNAVVIDGGTINLTGKGTITDDESVGIKVEGEDEDEDTQTVQWNRGCGFVIINDGKITINTVAKGITAHWKSSETYIGTYADDEESNTSLLLSTFLSESSATKPNPYIEINGGTIDITTTGTPYENRTGEKCSPEGIEAKGDLAINGGTITLSCTDDAINAGGSVYINGGAVYAYSSQNDAIDANGSSGIKITGGIIVAIGTNTPECAFDCDNYPFSITGGLLVGLGTNNYTAPQNCSQSTVVLSNGYYGSASTTMAITDSSGKAVFAYKLPSNVGSVMVLSSPEIKTGTTYTVKSGVSASGGTLFHNLYTTLPEITGGTSTTTFSTTTSNYVYTDASAGMNMGPQEGMRPENGGMPGDFVFMPRH